MKTIESQKIADFLGLKLNGKNLTITQGSSINNISPGSLVFANKYSQDLANILNNYEGQILALVVPEYERNLQCSHILVSNPRLEFAKVMDKFLLKKPSGRVAKTAIIGNGVLLGSDVTIGEYVVIGNNVQIGDHTEIRNHVVIGDNTLIGSHCLIKSHTVVGEEGFGFDFETDGTPIRIPHIGSVEIGNNVELGAFNTVAKATLEKTIIENHVKTDDHVHIAHNVIIGEKTIITACAEISGSVTIGKGVWVAPNASIINKISVGDRSLVGIGAVLTKDVAENSIVVGNPARRTGNRYLEENQL
jgi:UDP-3-O-[3-hydroxymyristoyl] glucosamine N-acyltransferase LpxD